MIGYTTIGTNDLERARAFYDAVLKPLGGRRTLSYARSQYYGSKGGAMLGVVLPFDGRPATAGNGVMIALAAGTRDQVEQMHRQALALGGSDEGAPGWRGEPGGFYAGYFRDLDGNKLCVYCLATDKAQFVASKIAEAAA